jgi:hypothetical protein
MSGTKYPVKQHHIPEELMPHPHCCKNLTHILHELSTKCNYQKASSLKRQHENKY